MLKQQTSSPPAMPDFDINGEVDPIPEILRFLQLVYKPEEVIEMRVPEYRGNDHGRTVPHLGYFNDRQAFADEAARMTKRAMAVYATLQHINPALLAKHKPNTIGKRGDSTKDKDVISYRRLSIDIDPDRPASTSATDSQVRESLALAWQIRHDLMQIGWTEPVFALSGNGGRLWWLINEHVDTAADSGTTLPARCLVALNQLYGGASLKIDTTLATYARIDKVPGTWARKGHEVPEMNIRHRQARIITAPDKLDVVPTELLQTLAAYAPEKKEARPAARTRQSTRARYDFESQDGVLAALREWGIEIKGEPKLDGEWLNISIKECPFDSDHRKMAVRWNTASHAIGYSCFHDGCSNNKWAEFRAYYDKDYGANGAWDSTPQIDPYMLQASGDGHRIKSLELDADTGALIGGGDGLRHHSATNSATNFSLKNGVFSAETTIRHQTTKTTTIGVSRSKMSWSELADSVSDLPDSVIEMLPDCLRDGTGNAPSNDVRDAWILAALTVLGSPMHRVRFSYGGTYVSPQLFSYAIADSVGGKSHIGKPAKWIASITKRLKYEHAEFAMPAYQASMIDYQQALDDGDKFARNPGEPPVPKQYNLGSQFTKAGLINALAQSHGNSLFAVTDEAERLAKANRGEHGGFYGDLRMAWDGQTITGRTSSAGFQSAEDVQLSVLLLSTPNQVEKVLPEKTDGTPSRFCVWICNEGFSQWQIQTISEDDQQAGVKISRYEDRMARLNVAIFSTLEKHFELIEAARGRRTVFHMSEGAAYNVFFPKKWEELNRTMGAHFESMFKVEDYGPELRAAFVRFAQVIVRMATTIRVLQMADEITEDYERRDAQMRAVLKRQKDEGGKLPVDPRMIVVLEYEQAWKAYTEAEKMTPEMESRLDDARASIEEVFFLADKIQFEENGTFTPIIRPSNEDVAVAYEIAQRSFLHQVNMLVKLGVPIADVSSMPVNIGTGENANKLRTVLNQMPDEFTRAEFNEVARDAGYGESAGRYLFNDLLGKSRKGRVRKTSRFPNPLIEPVGDGTGKYRTIGREGWSYVEN